MRLRPPLILSVPDAVTSRALNGRCHCAFFIVLFLLKINKRTVPALTCPYNYRHRMMTILFLLQAWHGYRWISSCRKSVFRFAVTDYMCLIQDAFPGIFFLNCDTGFAFYFVAETIILLTVNRLEKRRLGVIFFISLLTDWGLICVIRLFLLYLSLIVEDILSA